MTAHPNNTWVLHFNFDNYFDQAVRNVIERITRGYIVKAQTTSAIKRIQTPRDIVMSYNKRYAYIPGKTIIDMKTGNIKPAKYTQYEYKKEWHHKFRVTMLTNLKKIKTLVAFLDNNELAKNAAKLIETTEAVDAIKEIYRFNSNNYDIDKLIAAYVIAVKIVLEYARSDIKYKYVYKMSNMKVLDEIPDNEIIYALNKIKPEFTIKHTKQFISKKVNNDVL